MVKILWVDDEVELLKPHVLFLQQKGYEVDTCNNGYDAIDMASEGAYDLIILDPPAFAKHHKVLGNAMQGYKRLNARALSQIRPGGILFTFSCSQAVTKELFRTTVFPPPPSQAARCASCTSCISLQTIP